MRLAHQFQGQTVKGRGYRRAGEYRVGRIRRSHCLICSCEYFRVCPKAIIEDHWNFYEFIFWILIELLRRCVGVTAWRVVNTVTSLPGGQLVWHARVLTASPRQNLAPTEGLGWVHVLWRTASPRPQLKLHSLQADHALQPPSTVIQHGSSDIWRILLDRLNQERCLRQTSKCTGNFGDVWPWYLTFWPQYINHFISFPGQLVPICNKTGQFFLKTPCLSHTTVG